MSWHKVRRIIYREYVESVRKKSFLIGLVATPIMMLLMIFLPILASDIFVKESLTLAVLDFTDEYGPRLERALAEENGGLRVQLLIHGPGDAPAREELDAAVADGSLSGWILLPEDFASTGALEYHSESITNVTVLEILESRFDRILAEKKAADLGLDPAAVESLLRRVEMKTFRIGRHGGREADFTGVYLHAIALVMILFFALMPTGQILMRSVIEEKANRVIEVLLSSVTAKELMVGKIIGLGAVGLTLLAAWAACGLLLALRSAGAFPIDARELGVFLLYFFPGYFLYAALLGSIGSICNTERDAQPFQLPINLMLIFPVIIGFAIAQNPDHVLTRVFSFIPFFTPSLMLFRFTIKEPPVWEIAATWITLLASTVGMFWISSRVFRTGILLYGKRPTIPEVARWVWAR